MHRAPLDIASQSFDTNGFDMVCSALQLAQRALVQILLALAAQFDLRLRITRDSTDKAILTAYLEALRAPLLASCLAHHFGRQRRESTREVSAYTPILLFTSDVSCNMGLGLGGGLFGRRFFTHPCRESFARFGGGGSGRWTSVRGPSAGISQADSAPPWDPRPPPAPPRILTFFSAPLSLLPSGERGGKFWSPSRYL